MAKFQKGNKIGNRFKPGQSGNPKGKPMGALSFKEVLLKALDQDIERIDHLCLEPKQQKLMDHMMNTLLAKAIGKLGDLDSADTKAIDMIMDRIEGKPLSKNMDIPATLEDVLKEIDEEEKNGDS